MAMTTKIQRRMTSDFKQERGESGARVSTVADLQKLYPLAALNLLVRDGSGASWKIDWCQRTPSLAVCQANVGPPH